MKLIKHGKIEIVKQKENEVPCASTRSQFSICRIFMYYLYTLYKHHANSFLDWAYHHYDKEPKIKARY